MPFTQFDSSGVSPTLCIAGGVDYCRQTLSPKSSLYILDGSSLQYLPNWSFTRSLKHNSRIYGRYNLDNNFDQGYFNFEKWTNNVTFSTSLSKSGIQNNTAISGGAPYLVDFWGRLNTVVGATALYNFNYDSGNFRPNICRGVAMSGVNGGPYNTMDMYTGNMSPSGITIYGRVASSNAGYYDDDTILKYSTDTYGIGGGGGGGGTVGPTITGAASNDTAIGTVAWSSFSEALTDNGVGASIVNFTMATTNYLVTNAFGFTALAGKNISQITAEFDIVNVAGSFTQNEVRLYSGGVVIGTNKSTGAALGNGLLTFTWNSSEIGALTGNDASLSGFGVAFSINQTSVGPSNFEVDFVRLTITYTDPLPSDPIPLPINFSLINKGDGDNKRLNWKLDVNGEITYIDMPGFNVTNRDFSNFLMTYSSGTGYGSFYLARDDEPMILTNITYMGDISKVFNGIGKFYEDSYRISTNGKNNPKIITDYGFDSKAWTANNIIDFDNKRLNSSVFVVDNPSITYPSPSGSDSTSLRFHFPTKSSGTLGATYPSGSQLYNYPEHYIPLTSGVSNLLYEFNRSSFKADALALDFWAQNTGSNPSGNVSARINFGYDIQVSDRPYHVMTHYWSGFNVRIPSGNPIQVRMSGKFYNSSNSLIDLNDIDKYYVNNAELFMGAWYDNIYTEYNGDIDIYSAKVSLDGWCLPPSTGNSITLAVTGFQGAVDGITLFCRNQYSESGIPFVVNGAYYSSDGCTLYTAGEPYAQGGCTLFIGGRDMYPSGDMPLYINCFPTPEQSGGIPLSMMATTNPGLIGSITLNIGGPSSGTTNSAMNLFLRNEMSESLTASMNLFLRSEYPSWQDGVSLFCRNEYTESSGNITLFMRAPSGTLGAIPYSGAMPLFINREFESIAGNVSLFIGGPNQVDGGVPMFINGGTPYFSSIPLYVKGEGIQTGFTKLFTRGF